LDSGGANTYYKNYVTSLRNTMNEK
jgi:hypothetical protein